MKHLSKIMTVLAFTLLTHYFVLTYFNVNSTETFVGKVEKIELTTQGILPVANIKFEVLETVNGVRRVMQKTISLIQTDVKNFKIGKQYIIKAHNSWLLSINK